jgi:hypothetical protein
MTACATSQQYWKLYTLFNSIHLFGFIFTRDRGSGESSSRRFQVFDNIRFPHGIHRHSLTVDFDNINIRGRIAGAESEAIGDRVGIGLDSLLDCDGDLHMI